MTNEARQQNFELILSQYGGMVAKICYMYGDCDDARKDLYQECMANVWQGLKSFRGDSKLSTWVYRACINTCITCYKRERRHDAVTIDNIPEIREDENTRPGDLAEMYRLISLLNAVEKALIMMWLDEKSYDEISEITGIPRNTVASKLRRIKIKLVEMANS